MPAGRAKSACGVAVLTCIGLAFLGGNPVRAASLSSLRDLSTLEKRLVSAANDRDDKDAIAQQMKLIRGDLTSAKVSKRKAALSETAKRTAWGSPQRAAAYYVSAWYKVDYARSRDYLLNCFFWDERGHRSAGGSVPFTWADETADLLYRLYGETKDTRLLHDLIAGVSDGCGGEALDGIRVDAFARYPRAVLASAAMSSRARDFAVLALSGDYGSTTADTRRVKSAQSKLLAYARRVSVARKDALRTLATDLLREAGKLPTKSSSPVCGPFG